MPYLRLILLVFAFVCFVLAAYLASPRESKLVAAGLAFLTATQLWPGP